jgi:hypothetical protein
LREFALKKPPRRVRQAPRKISLVTSRAAGCGDFAVLRAEIAARIARRALDLVDCAMDAAEEGQFAAMKYLFEGVGLFPAAQASETGEAADGALARTLLHHLGLAKADDLGGNPLAEASIDDAVE